MAELLSSSDEEGDAPVRFSSPRGNKDSSNAGGLLYTGSLLDATDRSQSEDLFDLLLSTTTSPPAWKGRGGSLATSTSPYAITASIRSRYSDAANIPADQMKKPVISAKDILMKLVPTSSQSSTRLVPASATKSPTTTTYAASNRDSLGSSAGERRHSSLSVTPTWRSSDGEPSTTLPAIERIAMKYRLLRSQSPGASADSGAGSRNREVVGKEKVAYQALTTEATPVVRRPAVVEPKKTPERSPFWGVEGKKEEENKTAATTTYVSPFASKDGFIDMKRRRRESGENGVRYHDLSPETVYDDSKRAVAEIGNRPRHVTASSITTGKDASGEGADSDDGWMSDAKDIAMEQQEKRARVRATSLVGSLKGQERNALSLTKVESKSLKRPRKRHSGSDDDELAPEDTERWPRLPFPESIQGPLTLTSSEEGARSSTICANINNFLFDYQRVGAQFLYDAYSKDTGAILGDEMGLGKTIQVVAFVAAILGKCGDLRDKEAWCQLRSRRREAVASMPLGEQETVFDMVPGPRPLLVVVPASLLHNWEAELRTWLCCCTVILHGKPEERDAIVKQIFRGEYEIVICSYDILKMTVERLNSIPWEAVIFDEMHCLKNPVSQLTIAVQSMTCARKLGLTGTLMQNNEKELHCVIDTIAPGVLGTWNEFRAYYGDDIKYGRKKSAVAEALERSRRKEKLLRQVISPYYLRRDRDINPRFQEIKKTDQVVFCDLTPYQLAAYKRILAMPEFELLRRGEEICDCGRNSKRKRKQCCYMTPACISDSRALIWERFHQHGACDSCPNCVGLVCVAQLLKLSNHMELLKVNPRDSPEMQDYGADFAAEAFGEDIDEVGGVEQVSSFQEMRSIGTKTCGKMQVLEKLLALWKKRKQRTLLFSRSTRMLDILQLFLISKATTYLRLDGQTKVDDRLRLVNEFNSPDSNASVFLISTKAGGLGLNLPTATNVVIFDPSWNPAHDCQAQDRAYRIGQTKDVQVYRLITLGTIEEMIYVRQIYKQQLSDTTLKGVKAPRYFEGVQGDRNQQGELFGIRNLLCWKEGGVLKGIQDAYRRGDDGLLIRENEVDYTKAAQPKASSKAKTLKHQGDEEMVELADELVGNIVVPKCDEEQKVESSNPAALEPVDSDSDCDTNDYLLGGATTFMHEAIVGDNKANPLSDSNGEREFVEPEQEMRSDTNAERRKPPQSSALTQKRLSFGQAQQKVSPKRASGANKKAKSTPPAPQPTHRKNLYIPRYL